MTDSSFDFDLIVIGAGYGGFDAAKHAAAKGLKVAIMIVQKNLQNLTGKLIGLDVPH